MLKTNVTNINISATARDAWALISPGGMPELRRLLGTSKLQTRPRRSRHEDIGPLWRYRVHVPSADTACYNRIYKRYDQLRISALVAVETHPSGALATVTRIAVAGRVRRGLESDQRRKWNELTVATRQQKERTA